MMMTAKEKAIKQMNEYGENNIPFLFVIDYEMQMPEVIPLREVDCRQILFSIGSLCNYHESTAELRQFSFEKNPVCYACYCKAFDLIMENIRKGNTYLANLTFPTAINTSLSLRDIFFLSRAKYKLFFDDRFVVFSPETFIRIEKGRISTFPMKGTIDASVKNAREKLLYNAKEAAEHATIVDLLRNDLSKVARGVEVKRYRYVEEIVTHEKKLLQTSSEITGELPHDYAAHIGTLLFSLLPAGSVTGAPKNKTVEIIARAEKIPRGYYTGIFGYFDGQVLESAVMIRFIENFQGLLRYRSGGGITFASCPEDEYREMIDKVYVPFY